MFSLRLDPTSLAHGSKPIKVALVNTYTDHAG